MIEIREIASTANVEEMSTGKQVAACEGFEAAKRCGHEDGEMA